ncbi:MAG: haloacid dehalogenase [Chloroflexi bacterium]|nr:MAG: haloacid dehalogenase [Chloroflexota bacterium]HDN79942.1 haloacid dehalogenase [Chloroflexota bacterium]
MEKKNAARDEALAITRELTRHCALSIRACHRNEWDNALQLLEQAKEHVRTLKSIVAPYPDLYHSGYTQDSIKEFVEATLTYAIIRREPVPTPEELEVEYETYLRGMGEAMGELRRYVLDLIRRDELERGEELLTIMDEVYALLMTVDYPNAITGGLRRISDIVRGVVERTRSDLTAAFESRRLRESMQRFRNALGEEAGD